MTRKAIEPRKKRVVVEESTERRHEDTNKSKKTKVSERKSKESSRSRESVPRKSLSIQPPIEIYKKLEELHEDVFPKLSRSAVIYEAIKYMYEEHKDGNLNYELTEKIITKPMKVNYTANIKRKKVVYQRG